ncbi:MAG: ABC transporter permease [Caldilineaceae bacterium]|nr:ABC transporter permease [Caldilineaceae bacterium]
MSSLTKSRLFSTFIWDTRLQWRQGLYVAALFVIGLWVLVLTQLPPSTVELLLPFILFFDLSVFGFYFMAGLLFLEKGDGVLEALVVSPLRSWEYLVSKVATLTLLAVLVSIVVVVTLQGVRLNWFYLIAGVALNSWFLVLVGFILAAGYDSVTDFLIPSIVFVVPSQIPALDYFGIWQNWLVYLVPTQPAMLLLAGAFDGLATWQVLYAFGYGLAACLCATWWARRSFARFVVRSAGGS